MYLIVPNDRTELVDIEGVKKATTISFALQTLFH